MCFLNPTTNVKLLARNDNLTHLCRRCEGKIDEAIQSYNSIIQVRAKQNLNQLHLLLKQALLAKHYLACLLRPVLRGD